MSALETGLRLCLGQGGDLDLGAETLLPEPKLMPPVRLVDGIGIDLLERRVPTIELGPELLATGRTVHRRIHPHTGAEGLEEVNEPFHGSEPPVLIFHHVHPSEK